MDEIEPVKELNRGVTLPTKLPFCLGEPNPVVWKSTVIPEELQGLFWAVEIGKPRGWNGTAQFRLITSVITSMATRLWGLARHRCLHKLKLTTFLSSFTFYLADFLAGAQLRKKDDVDTIVFPQNMETASTEFSMYLLECLNTQDKVSIFGSCGE